MENKFTLGYKYKRLNIKDKQRIIYYKKKKEEIKK